MILMKTLQDTSSMPPACRSSVSGAYSKSFKQVQHAGLIGSACKDERRICSSLAAIKADRIE